MVAQALQCSPIYFCDNPQLRLWAIEYTGMNYHPRIETADLTSFITTRCRNSELWFVNNRPLENAILGYVAKFAARYDAKLYAFAIEGNHTHCVADFPNLNRSSFMRDLNSCTTRAVRRLVLEYPGGPLWGRRYSGEFLPGNEDVEEYFFYTALQPIQDGLVERLSDYPGYNCFHDAIWGISKTFTVVDWARYNSAKRYNKSIRFDDYVHKIRLKYERLPGYEHLSQAAYAKMMIHKLEVRRQKIVAERFRMGMSFLGRNRLLAIEPGSLPVSTKSSTRYSHRPRILSVSPERRAYYRDWYFGILQQYVDASRRYRQGDRKVLFPAGTFLPLIFGELHDPSPTQSNLSVDKKSQAS